MSKILVKPLIFDKEQIKKLYVDNEWYSYTNDIESLYNGIKNSTETLAAYIDNDLIGLIRVVSDKHTICYIQDILILKEYHRQGIGSLLMNPILDKYSNCRQILLMTDSSEKTRNFYEKIGFISYEQAGAVGFTFKK